MATLNNNADGIVTLSAGDDYSEDRMYVDSIVLSADVVGAFVLTVGNTSMTITTSTGGPVAMQITFNRRMNYVKLVSGPTNAVAYVLKRRM